MQQSKEAMLYKCEYLFQFLSMGGMDTLALDHFDLYIYRSFQPAKPLQSF